MSDELEVDQTPIRVGSRKSELALIQTKHVISRLQKLYPSRKFEIHTMSTIGDRVLNVSLPKIGEKSLFTRDLEDALRNGGVDFVVHSLKDLPTALPPGMAIGAILEREDSRDALVLNEKYKGHTIATLPAGCVIGTSSLRRTAQLRRNYPNLEVCDIRGNLNTRLAKLDAPASKFAGIILAQAGLVRMGWTHRISQVLEPTEVLYAVGQGALAVECRSNDDYILEMLHNLMCITTTCKILAERSFLKTLGGGCSAPVAVCSDLDDIPADELKAKGTLLRLIGAVWSLDGKTELQSKLDCSLVIDKYTDNDIEDDVTPTKRAKLDVENNVDEEKRRQPSPPIINDDALTAAGDGDNVSDIINIHGELFKKCPFFLQHSKDKNENETSGNCPLNIPVGQDFMGKCPYADATTLASISHSSKCPVTGAQTINKEPQPTVGHDKCPFLQKNNVKMFDYGDDEKPISQKILPILSETDSDELFCGIYQHKSYTRELYSKCVGLGKRLADDLIAIGALKVMKFAQDEIHAKV